MRGLRRALATAAVAMLAGLAGAVHMAAKQAGEAPGRRNRLERHEKAMSRWMEADALRQTGGDIEKAIERLKEAQELDPENPRLIAALGDALLEAGHAGEARAAFEAARAKGPKGLRLRQYLAERLKK
jgi:tetratricopeptide (TPR) repeat protein